MTATVTILRLTDARVHLGRNDAGDIIQIGFAAFLDVSPSDVAGLSALMNHDFSLRGVPGVLYRASSPPEGVVTLSVALRHDPVGHAHYGYAPLPPSVRRLAQAYSLWLPGRHLALTIHQR